MTEKKLHDADAKPQGRGDAARGGRGETVSVSPCLRVSASSLSPRRPLAVRIISLALALCLLVGDPIWAAGVSEFIHSNFSSDLRTLSVPSRFGAVTDRWIPRTDAETRRGGDAEKTSHRVTVSPRPRVVVVLIQDLHANIGVQKKISGILEHLYGRYGVTSFYSEAAFGLCDVSLLRMLPNRTTQNRLIHKSLSSALLTGPEIAAMRLGDGPLSPVRLQGVDDAPLYLANVQAFRDLVGGGTPVILEWKSMKEFLMPGAAPGLRRHLELVE
jgi:hypothetical protein